MPIIDKPAIHLFTASATQVMADEEIVLDWEVLNARKVKLDNVEQDLKSSYKAYINYTRTFELTATNWAGKESKELTISLFTPRVMLFETDSISITEDQPVNIHMQLKYARYWQIVAEYTASPGSKEIIGEGRIENGCLTFDHMVTTLLKGACTLRLITRNGHEPGPVETIRLGTRNVSIELFTDKKVVIEGSSIRVTWKAENARKILLNPGNTDVTDLSHVDLTVSEGRDLQLEITAYGDFSNKHTDTLTVFLATINYFNTSQNGDLIRPEFYLNWSATGVNQMKLLPDNITVRETELNYRIPASTSTVTYTLVGQTSNGEEVTKSLSLKPCSLQEFVLEKGMVIIGNMATLQWKAANARRIQLEFSDSISPVDIPAHEEKHHFQVFENRDKVKLIAWGDINVVESEIPIPRFVGAVIKQLQLPSLNLQLGVTWMPSPLTRSSQKVHELFSLTKKTGEKNAGLYHLICRIISHPSKLLLHVNRKTRAWNTYEKSIRHRPVKIAQHSAQLIRSLYQKLKQPLYKKLDHEQ